MKLAEYLAKNDLSEAAFARLAGIAQPTVNRYINNERFPTPDIIERISSLTRSEVSERDWFAQRSAAKIKTGGKP